MFTAAAPLCHVRRPNWRRTMTLRTHLIPLFRFLLPDEFWWAVEQVRDQLFEETRKDYLADVSKGPFIHIHESIVVLDRYLTLIGRGRWESQD